MDEEWPKEEKVSKRWGENGVSGGKMERWREENEGKIEALVRWWEGGRQNGEKGGESVSERPSNRERRERERWGIRMKGKQAERKSRVREKISFPSVICYMEDNEQIFTTLWQMSYRNNTWRKRGRKPIKYWKQRENENWRWIGSKHYWRTAEPVSLSVPAKV